MYLNFTRSAPKSFCDSTSFTAQPRLNLSEREREVLRLLDQGKTNREIARILHIIEGTIRNYISRILSELGVSDRTQSAL
ncbi:response regulator transcription factor [Oculatella sp. FACHB-28]|nr:response regulator transcription factor [Oculatella sp. FACHB-28]